MELKTLLSSTEEESVCLGVNLILGSEELLLEFISLKFSSSQYERIFKVMVEESDKYSNVKLSYNSAEAFRRFLILVRAKFCDRSNIPFGRYMDSTLEDLITQLEKIFSLVKVKPSLNRYFKLKK